MKSLTKAFIFFLALALAGCGGASGVSPTAVPVAGASGAASGSQKDAPGAPATTSGPTVIATSDGNPVPEFSVDISGGLVKVSTPGGYVSPRVEPVGTAAVQYVDLRPIPEGGWTQDEVVELLFRDSNDYDRMAPFAPVRKPVAVVPIGDGWTDENLAYLSDGVAYVASSFGHDFHVAGPEESLVGAVKVEVALDPTKIKPGAGASASRSVGYDGYVLSGTIYVHPDAIKYSSYIPHELGHIWGLKHTRNRAGLMNPYGSPNGLFTEGELRIAETLKVRPARTTAPDTAPSVASSSRVSRGFTEVFICH